MSKKHSLKIESENPPVVEVDSDAHAAYVRFSNHPVAKTIPLITTACLVTMDVDSAGKTIGVELIGVEEFGIEPLLKKAGFSPLPQSLINPSSGSARLERGAVS